MIVGTFNSVTVSPNPRGDEGNAIDGNLGSYSYMTASGARNLQTITLTMASPAMLTGVRIHTARKADCCNWPIRLRFEIGGTVVAGVSDDASLTTTASPSASGWHVDALPAPPSDGATAAGSEVNYRWPAISTSSLTIDFQRDSGNTHWSTYELLPLTH